MLERIGVVRGRGLVQKIPHQNSQAFPFSALTAMIEWNKPKEESEPEVVPESQ